MCTYNDRLVGSLSESASLHTNGFDEIQFPCNSKKAAFRQTSYINFNHFTQFPQKYFSSELVVPNLIIMVTS